MWTLFAHNGRYYHLLKYWPFLLNHPVCICIGQLSAVICADRQHVLLKCQGIVTRSHGITSNMRVVFSSQAVRFQVLWSMPRPADYEVSVLTSHPRQSLEALSDLRLARRYPWEALFHYLTLEAEISHKTILKTGLGNSRVWTRRSKVTVKNCALSAVAVLLCGFIQKT